MNQEEEAQFMEAFRSVLTQLCELTNKARRSNLEVTWAIQPINPSSKKSPLRITQLSLSKTFVELPPDGKKGK
jgi:hypothetical protein